MHGSLWGNNWGRYSLGIMPFVYLCIADDPHDPVEG